MKVIWRRNALLDLAEIDTYIRQKNPQAANRVVSNIRRETSVLTKLPLIGREGRIENSRELVIGQFPYIVAYQITPSAVEILAVIHSAQLWPENF
ncbi:MAG: type II toxin-antitoxin system RelE/ParE family toxin [Methylophilaceae bacterium]